jgi:hypothetical protein
MKKYLIPILISILALVSVPKTILAIDYRVCSGATYAECISYRNVCSWNGDKNSGSCVPEYAAGVAFGDKVSETILYNPDIDPLKNKFTDVGSIISALLPYVLTIAGLILFGMLIAGGFSMLTAASDPKKAEGGKQKITTAIIGFIIIFTAYWLTQILEIVLGIKIL